ncbi:MAG TPA: glycosyltransferase family 2 protein [Anaerolineales bacterium]|nr:glycosyltransferase family 2 protein [Anaerolineales bacterium]
MSKLSIIIPVYNEQDTLQQIVERVWAVDLGPTEKEIIIANDGSTDATPAVITQLQQTYPQLRTYSSPTNLGKGAAVRQGIAISSGDLIVIQDADLELDPGDYPNLLEPLLAGQSEIVYGSRFLKAAGPVPRHTRLANRFLTWLTNFLFRGHLTDMETAYKMFRRSVYQGIRLRGVHFDFEPEITANFLKRGYRILEVPITYHPRTVQKGKKISWVDGIEAIYTLFRCRFIDPPVQKKQGA